MFEHKVVVKLKDGALLKGAGELFFTNDRRFDFMDVDGRIRTIELSEVYAVFFVRDLAGNPNRADRRPERASSSYGYGRVVDVLLPSGETIRGRVAGDRRPEDFGTFLHPLDPRDNNQNVFVPFASVVSMSDVELAAPGAGGRPPHPAARH